MAGSRLPGEASRERLIEAAAQIINREGYAALSARSLAERVGLKRQIVHYYFRTMDELLLAVIRHYGDEAMQRFSEAMRSENPLQVIWEMAPDSSSTTFAFIAMASHKPVIREELLTYLRKFRELQSRALSRYLRAEKIKPVIPTVAAVIIMQSVAQTLIVEAGLGNDLGHAETRAAIANWLATFSARATSARKASR